MLPVSGAEQLNTSDDHRIRPISSAQNAYWRLVRPGPSNSKLSSTGVAPCDGGMNRFHRPSAARLGFQLLDHRKDLPALALALLRVIIGDARADMLVHEGADAVAPLGLGGPKAEIHAPPPIS